MSSVNDDWPGRWDELVDDLDRQKQALQCEQERWAEWHAVQEQALLDQVRELDERENELNNRERLLAETLRALEQDAIQLDERYERLRLDQQLFREEVRNHQQNTRAAYHGRSAPPRVARKRAYAAPRETGYYDSFDAEEDGDEDEEDEEIDEEEQFYEHRHRPLRSRQSPRARVRNNENLFRDRAPPNRRLTSPDRRRRHYNMTPSAVSPATGSEGPSANGAFEVRVNSPDNTRVQVTYRDNPPPMRLSGRDHSTRAAASQVPKEYMVDAAAQSRRQAVQEMWRSLPPPAADPVTDGLRNEVSPVVSGYSKVNAGIQASGAIKHKIRTLRESVLPVCGVSSEDNSSSVGLHTHSSEHPPESRTGLKIADIVRTVTPLVPSSSSGEKMSRPTGGSDRPASLEHRISKFAQAGANADVDHCREAGR